jgi:hypothetical protein
MGFQQSLPRQEFASVRYVTSVTRWPNPEIDAQSRDEKLGAIRN